MAQEQAKSPPGKATPEAKDEVEGPSGSDDAGQGQVGRRADPGARLRTPETLHPSRPAQGRAAQARRAQARRTENTEFQARRAPSSARSAARRRPSRPSSPRPRPVPPRPSTSPGPAAPPARRRSAASPRPPMTTFRPSADLIFALQQRPSRTPFLVALAASVTWFLIGGIFAYGVISNQAAGDGLLSAAALSAAAALLVPIVIFWFLALLVWRAQELRLMASAMTEVAVRLAEPDQYGRAVGGVGRTDHPAPGGGDERRDFPRHRPGERARSHGA